MVFLWLYVMAVSYFTRGRGLFGKLTCFGGGKSEFEIVFGELLHASTHSTGTVIDLL